MLIFSDGAEIEFSSSFSLNFLSSSLQTTAALVSRSGTPPPAVRLLRVLHDPSLARLLPREASLSPLSVTLCALSDALNPHGSTVDIEPIKHSLRTCGGLKAVAQVAASQSRALVDPSPTMDTVQGLWKLQQYVMNFYCRSFFVIVPEE